MDTPRSFLWGPATASVLYRVVKITAAKTVGYPAADTDHMTGVVNEEGVAQGMAIAIETTRGKPVKVKCTTATSIAAGSPICPDGTAVDGTVKFATTGDRVCGEAITAPVSGGDVFWAYLYDGPTL